MSFHIVRKLKEHGPTRVLNAMGALGWVWKDPKRAPRHVDAMVRHMTKPQLEEILNYLES